MAGKLALGRGLGALIQRPPGPAAGNGANASTPSSSPALHQPAPGERVASLAITLPGLTVGRVPLVVSSVPPPPPIPDEPWWERAAGAVADALDAVASAVGG